MLITVVNFVYLYIVPTKKMWAECHLHICLCSKHITILWAFFSLSKSIYISDKFQYICSIFHVRRIFSDWNSEVAHIDKNKYLRVVVMTEEKSLTWRTDVASYISHRLRDSMKDILLCNRTLIIIWPVWYIWKCM